MTKLTLSDYPYTTVRLTCATCERRGRYKLARLAERFGADANLVAVLSSLAASCPIKAREDNPGVVRCGARYADLHGGPPHDHPPAAVAPRPKLRAVKI